VANISVFNEFVSQKLYFYDAKSKLGKGTLQCPSSMAIELGALALQVLQGDHLSDSATRHHLDTAELLPDSVIVEFGSSLEKCADMVNTEYRKLKGMSEPSAVLAYLTIIQKLPTYGVHYYAVKDSHHHPTVLGISPIGIAMYDANDKVTPRKSYVWSQLVNVSWKKKTRFELEVLDTLPAGSPTKPFRSGSGMSSPAGAGPAIGASTLLVYQAGSDMGASQMLHMVLFQHTHSIQMQKVLRRRANTLRMTPAHARPGTAGSGRGGASAAASGNGTLDAGGSRDRSFSTSKRVLTPATEVRLPSGATGISDALLSDRPFDSPLRVTLFSNDGGDDTNTGTDTSHAAIEALERRRHQLLMELGRKRTLLAQYEEERTQESLRGGGDGGGGAAAVESAPALLIAPVNAAAVASAEEGGEGDEELPVSPTTQSGLDTATVATGVDFTRSPVTSA